MPKSCAEIFPSFFVSSDTLSSLKQNFFFPLKLKIKIPQTQVEFYFNFYLSFLGVSLINIYICAVYKL